MTTGIEQARSVRRARGCSLGGVVNPAAFFGRLPPFTARTENGLCYSAKHVQNPQINRHHKEKAPSSL